MGYMYLWPTYHTYTGRDGWMLDVRQHAQIAGIAVACTTAEQVPYRVKSWSTVGRTLQARGMNGRRLKYLSSIRECISGANEMLEWRALLISAFSTDRQTDRHTHTDMAYIPEPESVRDRCERVLRPCALCAPAGASGVTRHYEPASPSSVPIATRPAVRVMYRVERWQHGLDGPERTRGREDETATQQLRLHAILESSAPDVPLLLLSVLLPEPNRHHRMLSRPS